VRKAQAYDVAATVVDGMDALAVEAAAQEAVTYVREGHGPYFLECRTYRYRAHSMFDAELYRSKEEVEEWKKRDPILQLTRQLQAEAWLKEADLAQLERKVAAEIIEAVAFAEGGTWEPVADLERFVYSERRM
jgi:pyruvate dehydrogenase E1 component alpha subunit/2-oxoisovalerate dehydrogenase E1 component